MARPKGFEWTLRRNGEVVITDEGRLATTVRGKRAAAFVHRIGSGDDQELMARMTGNSKQGNERRPRQRPANPVYPGDIPNRPYAARMNPALPEA